MQTPHIFAEFIRTDGIIFKHAKGMRDILGLEFHPFHELFVFVGGDAEFVCDRFRAPLTAGTLVVIPKESFHTFVVHGKEEDYHRFVFNFGDLQNLQPLIEEKMQQVTMLPLSEAMLSRLTRLGESKDDPQYKQALRMQALFTDLLLDIEAAHTERTDSSTIHPLLTEAIRYITANAPTISSVEEIARAVNVSASHLSHLFRGELHISPHRYLLEQRLILAHRKILGGMSAGSAASECGFGNYSGFYKMYKRMFGTPPSAILQKNKQ